MCEPGPKAEKVSNSTECKEQEMRHNVMFVSYYPNPCCGEEKKVFVSRKGMTGCFLSKQNVNMVTLTICVRKLREMSHVSKKCWTPQIVFDIDRKKQGCH